MLITLTQAAAMLRVAPADLIGNLPVKPAQADPLLFDMHAVGAVAARWAEMAPDAFERSLLVHAAADWEAGETAKWSRPTAVEYRLLAGSRWLTWKGVNQHARHAVAVSADNEELATRLASAEGTPAATIEGFTFAELPQRVIRALLDGPLSSREVRTALADYGYSTAVLSQMLGRMFSEGLITRKRTGRGGRDGYIYNLIVKGGAE